MQPSATLTRPTPAMLSALKWLIARNGDGVFGEKTNRSVLIAAGDRARVMHTTWEKLAALGLVERYGTYRLCVTEAGRQVDLGNIEESTP